MVLLIDFGVYWCDWVGVVEVYYGIGYWLIVCGFGDGDGKV